MVVGEGPQLEGEDHRAEVVGDLDRTGSLFRPAGRNPAHLNFYRPRGSR